MRISLGNIDIPDKKNRTDVTGPKNSPKIPKVRPCISLLPLLLTCLSLILFLTMSRAYAAEEHQKNIFSSLLPLSAPQRSKPAPKISGELKIFTSYPKSATDFFKALFEKKYPDVRLVIEKKKTTAAMKLVQSTSLSGGADLFWASAPDAFEVLKSDGLLAKANISTPGIPRFIGGYPVNDVDSFYRGFAASGYGIMWNTNYLQKHDLPAPRSWHDLTKAIYHGHVGMSAPSRSGTTHLTVEAILQGLGWEKGWALIKEMGGNLQTVTKKSSGVPKGVKKGKFGIGIVIDFYGLTAKAGGKPIGFIYPKITTLVPANIAIVKSGKNRAAAEAFIKFLLSKETQKILLKPEVSRLPVNKNVYVHARPDFPNPFKDTSIGSAVPFNLQTSASRYGVINSLFDTMITYNLPELREAVRSLQKARAALLKSPGNDVARTLILDAEDLVAAMPIDAAKASVPEFNRLFKIRRKSKKTIVSGKQNEIEQAWEQMIKKNYAKAGKLANRAIMLLERQASVQQTPGNTSSTRKHAAKKPMKHRQIARR